MVFRVVGAVLLESPCVDGGGVGGGGGGGCMANGRGLLSALGREDNGVGRGAVWIILGLLTRL